MKTTNPVSLVHLAKLAKNGFQFGSHKLTSAQMADLFQCAKIYCRANGEEITGEDKKLVVMEVYKHAKRTKTDVHSLFGKTAWLHKLKHYLECFHRNKLPVEVDLPAIATGVNNFLPVTSPTA